MKYSGEHATDKWLHEHVFRNRVGGIFVEFGAIDGILHSNTLFFERALGWRGLCLEPNPFAFERLRMNRQCDCLNYAISGQNGTMDFEVFTGGLLGWSGLKDHIEDQHRERIEKHIPEESRSVIKVETMLLNDVLTKAGIDAVDYMVIDVEGAELAVLEKFDFRAHPVTVFDVENNFGGVYVEQLMARAGYRKIIRIDVNDIYMKG